MKLSPPVFIEAISKPRIRSESKAQADEKAQHTREYVSILKRLATQLSGLRRGFETASTLICKQQKDDWQGFLQFDIYGTKV